MPDLSTEADYSRLRVLDFFRVNDRAGAGWLAPQWLTAIREDPSLRNARITVDLVFGQDTVVRLATTPMKVTSGATGDEVVYPPLLRDEPEVTWTYTVGDGSAEVQSVTVALPAKLVEPARLVRHGRMLAGYGEVCLQLPGGDYDQRIVLLRGEMTGGVDFGEDDEEIEVEISDPKITADLVVPPWVADTERHPDLPEDWSGERYPIVFNGYNGIECIRLTQDTGWPTGQAPNWLACYGHGFTVDTVYVNGEAKSSGDASYPWAVVESVDNQGTPYTGIDFAGTATTWDDSDSVHASITADEKHDLIAIIQKLVEEYSVLGPRGANAPMFSRARSKLPKLLPNVIINASNAADEAGILSFVEETLLESFPMVSMGWRHGKYGPIVTDYRGNLPAADLVAGEYPLIDRISGVQEKAKEDLYNYFTLRYNWDPISEVFRGIATRHPGNDTTCRISRDQVGARHHETVESHFIQTASQANYVIDWMVAHKAVPSYYVEWECHPWVFLFLWNGDLVWYTDAKNGWTAERATVETLTYRRGRSVLGLRVWPGRKRLTTLRA